MYDAYFFQCLQEQGRVGKDKREMIQCLPSFSTANLEFPRGKLS